MDADSRRLLTRNAELNGVSAKLVIDDVCTLENFAAVLEQNSKPRFVMCDVEGFEDQLLDPSRFPALSGCHVLVEVHEVLCAGVAGRLQDRFGSTHVIQEFQPVPRKRSEFVLENTWTRLVKDFHVTQAIGGKGL